MRNNNSKLRKVLPVIAGLVLSTNAHGQATDSAALESFDYASHRNVPAIDGKSHMGEIHSYSLLPDATIAELNKKGVKILPMWFYDIDNDGKFGQAEKDAMKKGIPIFMHEEFNNIANAKIRKSLERFLEITIEYNSLREKMEQESKNSKEGSEKLRFDYEEKKSKLEADILQLEANILELRKDYTSYDSSVQKNIEQKSQSPISDNSQKKEKGYTLVSLIAQGNTDFAFDNFGGSLGVRVNPFKNKEIGFGAGIDVGFGLDKLVDSYYDVLTERLATSGSITDTSRLSLGASAEMQFGPFVVGAGADYRTAISKSVANIIKDGVITKSNSDSTPSNKVYGRVYGGLELPITSAWKIGAVCGYDDGNGPYFGVRSVFRLNQPKKEK